MAGKGSKDRGNPTKRRRAAVWCKQCGKMRGGSCICAGKAIMDALLEACGYETDKLIYKFKRTQKEKDDE